MEKNGEIILTQKLFRELDILARKNQIPIRVLPREEMSETNGRKHFGYVNFFGHGVFVNLRESEYLTDKAVITLSERICWKDFITTPAPELDWSKIPKSQAYKFVVYHEIGHLKYSRAWFTLPRELWDDRDKMGLIRICDEMRADRFAWKSLFPRVPLPVRQGQRTLVRKRQAFQRKNPELFHKGINLMPITTDPYQLVPVEHFKDGKLIWGGNGPGGRKGDFQGGEDYSLFQGRKEVWGPLSCASEGIP